MRSLWVVSWRIIYLSSWAHPVWCGQSAVEVSTNCSTPVISACRRSWASWPDCMRLTICARRSVLTITSCTALPWSSALVIRSWFANSIGACHSAGVTVGPCNDFNGFNYPSVFIFWWCRLPKHAQGQICVPHWDGIIKIGLMCYLRWRCCHGCLSNPHVWERIVEDDVTGVHSLHLPIWLRKIRPDDMSWTIPGVRSYLNPWYTLGLHFSAHDMF